MKIEWREFNTISNYLSLARFVLAIPVFILLGMVETYDYLRWVIFGILILAAFTDYFDGFFARKFNEITEVGKFLDPLADKVMMAIIVIRLYQLDMIPAFLFWIIISRDILIFAGGLFVSNIHGKILPSNNLGKITVFVLGVYMLFVIGGAAHDDIFYVIFLYASVVLSFASLIAYAIRANEIIKWNKNGSL